MSRRFVAILASALALALAAPGPARAGSAEGKEGPVDLGRADARLRGYHAPEGFKVRVAAAEPTLVDPAAMAFDDLGRLYVAEWKPADRMVETWDTLALPEGGSTRVRRSRKGTLDSVKRLGDLDGDGVYESAEVVVDGCEMPTSILPYKDSLILACVGRLEKWADQDGDGKFESRSVLADGFAAVDRRGLSGITLGADGWLYLTVGDNDSHVVGSDGSRVTLSRTGGVVRCRVDGSNMHLVSMGLRNPYRGLAFDGSFAPFLLDGGDDDGSNFQGVRLIGVAEEGDYGWRLRPGLPSGPADFDRAAVNGERPGKLPGVARLGRGAPSGLVVYNGTAFPEALRGTLIGPDASRRAVRAFQVEPKGGSYAFKGETTVLSADDDQFRPCQAAVGADGAIYVLDRRGTAPADGPPWGEGKAGRLYRITWEGEPASPSPTKPKANDWKRLSQATDDQLVFEHMASADFAEADRALRELLDRGPKAVTPCLAWAGNPAGALHARLLGIQGARQFWSDQVEGAMVALLTDPQPEVRRLAAQALAWEPKAAQPRLVPKLIARLDDPDPRVARELALALGRHAEPRPQQTAAVLLRWLYAHPQADPPARDAFVRALERLGDMGVEEVALAARTRRGTEREWAVAYFASLRSAHAADQLAGLVKVPDLTGPERLALVRQYKDIPLDIPMPTQGLAEWVARHSEVDPAVKVAALDACRLAGNPASALVLGLLDDEDESVRLAATQIAARSRPPGATEKLIERLDLKSTSDAERLAIVRALRTAGPRAFAPLESLYLASEDPAVRRAALRSMADADRARAQPALESALSGPDPALRAQAVRILGESPATALALGKAFLARTLGRADLPAVLGSLRKQDGAEARKLLASIEEDATRGTGAVDPADIDARLAKGADAWSGLGVFFRESSRCSTCHQVEGRGRSNGPSLTLGTPAPSAKHLIESILDPSKTISERSEPPRTAQGEGRGVVRTVARRDSKTSAMPATVSLGLTPDEIADVVAFLQSKPAQGSLKNGPTKVDRALAIGPFALGADRLRLPLDRVDLARPSAGLDGAQVRWTPLESTASCTFNLRGELGARPSRVFLAVQVRSAGEQSAALRYAAEGSTRVYLNGAKVADRPERDPSSLEHAFDRPAVGCLAPLPDLARLPLKPGWNLMIIALDGTGQGDARASFEIASPEPVEVRTPRN